MKTLLLVLLVNIGICQKLKPGFEEKKWAIFHPFAAIKLKSIQKRCTLVYDSVMHHHLLDNKASGGTLDAYRHIFYMAAFSQKVKEKKLRKLGLAHEKSNYKQFKKGNLEFGEAPDSLSTVMDLNNNEIGFKIGKNAKKLTLIQLSNKVIEEIKAGNALIMKRNNKGDYLDCEGRIIDLMNYKKIWNIPKCLVHSNEH